MRRGLVAGILLAFQVALFWASAYWQGLGAPLWHHNASLVGTLLLMLPFVRSWQNRAFLGIGILVTSVLATGSGFYLLYDKQHLKAIELKDWMKFWHLLWSWAALWFFILHTWVNRKPLGRFFKRWHKTIGGWLAYDGVLVLIVLACWLTWGPWHTRFTDGNYIPMTLWTWLVVAGVPYAAWLWQLWRTRVAARPTWAKRAPVQGFIDVWLFPMTILANVSGIPILYFGTKDTAWKYVAKYWHTWPSIAFAVLIFAHSIQFWPGVRRHWRQFDGSTMLAK